MSSHRGTRARGYRSEDTGDYGRARPGRRRSLVRFWPAMGLLAVSLTSAWAVGEVHFGGSQGVVFADNGSQASAGQGSSGGQDAGQQGGAQEAPDPGSPADDAVNAGPQGGTKPGGAPKPAPTTGRPTTGTPNTGNSGAASSRFGPVTALDREFITKLSEAALWQRPIGAEASKRASSALVKSAGTKIAAEQAGLQTKARSVASRLDVQLPTKPTSEQRNLMSEIQSAKGNTYDRVFVTRMRSAQGEIFPLVSEARVNTQNTLVRGLSQLASTATLRNMTFLEQTGLVGPGSVGSPQPSAPNTGGRGNGNTNGGTNGGANNGGTNDGQAAPPNADQGDLLPGDSLDGADQGGADTGGATGNTGGAANPPSTGKPAGSAPNKPNPNQGANAPSDPLDLPQGNPAENQAGSVATTPTSSILGPSSGNTGMYVIIVMLVISGLIFLIGLRGFYRRPR